MDQWSILQLQNSSRTLQRAAAKCKKNANKHKVMIKRHIREGNEVFARKEAEMVASYNEMYGKYLDLSMRVDKILAHVTMSQEMMVVEDIIAPFVQYVSTDGQELSVQKIEKHIRKMERKFEKGSKKHKTEEIDKIMAEAQREPLEPRSTLLPVVQKSESASALKAELCDLLTEDKD